MPCFYLTPEQDDFNGLSGTILATAFQAVIQKYNVKTWPSFWPLRASHPQLLGRES